MFTITAQDFLSQAALTFCTFAFVAMVRKLWPKLDGPKLVLACSVVSGLVLSCLATLLFGQGVSLGTWATWQGVILVGIGAGVGSFATANAWQWSSSKLPSTVRVDLAQDDDEDVVDMSEPTTRDEEPESKP